MDAPFYEALFGPGGARDPHLETRLVTTKRPGMELVVSAHKSVAILGLIGRAEDMHAILDVETDATMALRRQRDDTRTLIATAEADGRFRLAANHRHVHDNLDTVITALEALG